MSRETSWLSPIFRFFLEQKLVVLVLTAGLIATGLMVAPFDWNLGGLPRSPVPVDAIPDIGENQQIVFTPWPGRSPQDVDDQIGYPLSAALLALPSVKNVRSQSILGFSMIYVIFEDDVEFYWSRTRILEKLNSLPAGTLPEGVTPMLGPDATALGQVLWYTLEGHDEQGNPVGGFDLDELRSIQDWTVRFALLGAEGVAEVASIGGYVREYQVDVDPDAMRAYGVTLSQVAATVGHGNIDVGARTIELNRAEYVVRGRGQIRSLADIESLVVAQTQNVPVLVGDIAHVSLGPAPRRGVLDKAGTEVVGGVVVARHGDNPKQVLDSVKERIASIQGGLPQRTLDDGTVSRVTIVPFYDRSGLIDETLDTVGRALEQQVLITILIVMLMVFHLRSGLVISTTLPLAVLATFVGMKALGVEANIVALSGIAIAVGTIVDMGAVLCENILRRLEEAPPGASTLETVHAASVEVGGAVLTAVLTTIIGFLPVFALQGAEGKLFTPLAVTKTLALAASALICVVLLPALAHTVLSFRLRGRSIRLAAIVIQLLLGAVLGLLFHALVGAALILGAMVMAARELLSDRIASGVQRGVLLVLAVLAVRLLARAWEPLGASVGPSVTSSSSC